MKLIRIAMICLIVPIIALLGLLFWLLPDED